ncbi:methyl-accepting chemotaxis protein [Metabacillus fastidiosus]|uniref:methyl-accepting chemotaxis protein n=1 Tax=Metabacillus fastidiosus TaxID=1458 RepID=UPI003D2A9AF8
MILSKMSTRFMIAVSALALILGSTIGFSTYFIAKEELIKSGRMDMQHLVETAVSTLTYLNNEVESGRITLEKAQEQARDIILGPEIPENQGQVRDFKKSSFVYKDNSYIFAVKTNLEEALSPYLPIQKGDPTYELSQKVNSQLVNIAKSPDANDRFSTFQWANSGEESKEQVAFMSYFEPWDWNIGIGAYTDELYQGLFWLKWMTVTVTIVMTIVTLLFFYFLTRGQFSLMQRLAEGSTLIADGNLRVEKFPESNDELGQLSKSYNRMADNLKNLIHYLQNTSSGLVSSASNLSSISDQTLSSTDELNIAINEIAKGAVTQTEEIEQLNKNLESLNASIERMNQHNQEIVKITNDTKAVTDNGIHIVKDLKESNELSIKAVTEINSGITDLHQKVQNISSFTEIIKALTAQTNLLALNASIEAARAGEHGKGFAVVAEEVRKLAEESNHATLQIEERIAEIEHNTEMTMKATAHTSTASQQLNQNVLDVEKDFALISQAVLHTVGSMKQLSAEIDQTSHQSEGILIAIQSISAVSEQTSASIEEISASMNEQLTVTKEESNIATNLSETSISLDKLIQSYKL